MVDIALYMEGCLLSFTKKRGKTCPRPFVLTAYIGLHGLLTTNNLIMEVCMCLAKVKAFDIPIENMTGYQVVRVGCEDGE